MNLSTTLTRTLVTAGTLAVLAAGCGSNDPAAPARLGEPGAGTVDRVGVTSTRTAATPDSWTSCRYTADQVERAQTEGSLPACVRSRQQEARREYRRLTRVHHVGHQ
jgi:hypothetical protein